MAVDQGDQSSILPDRADDRDGLNKPIPLAACLSVHVPHQFADEAHARPRFPRACCDFLDRPKTQAP